MGFFKKAFDWLTKYEDKSRVDSPVVHLESDEEDEESESKRKGMEDNYDAWEEIDNFRANFFIGGWAHRKFKAMGDGSLRKAREERERKIAEEEGREYKSALERDLEAVARKREEKQRRKEEKRRQKEASK